MVCRELGVFEQTYYWWQNQYGGLKELAEENFSARAGAAVAYLIRTVPVSEQMARRLVGRSRLAYRRPLKGDTVTDPDRALRDWLHALRVPTGVSRRTRRRLGRQLQEDPTPLT